MDASNQDTDIPQGLIEQTVHTDLAIEDIEPAPIGQLTSELTSAPLQRQRLGWLRTVLRNRKALLGIGIVLLFVLLSLLAPLITPGDPGQIVDAPHLSPSAAHLLGTDSLGRDEFHLLIWGGRGTLIVGFGAGLLTILVAIVIGTTAGYFRGRVDDVLTLLMNLFLVIPGLPLLILLTAFLKPGTATVIGALAFTAWAYSARVLRAQTLSTREQEFVNASIVSGDSDSYIIFREILPNLASVVASNFIGAVVYSIGAATSLSFLGLTSTSEVTWGTNLYWAQNGASLLFGAWWTFFPSGLAVALVAFGLTLINYGIDEVTNPRLRAERELSNVVKNTGRQRVRATPVIPRAH